MMGHGYNELADEAFEALRALGGEGKRTETRDVIAAIMDRHKALCDADAVMLVRERDRSIALEARVREMEEVAFRGGVYAATLERVRLKICHEMGIASEARGFDPETALHNIFKDTRANTALMYAERARLLVALSKLARSHGWAAGVSVDEQGHEGFRTLLFIDLPTGQVSWHLSDADVRANLYDANLSTYERAWDGHDQEEKWRRVRNLKATPHTSYARAIIDAFKEAGLDTDAVFGTKIDAQAIATAIAIVRRTTTDVEIMCEACAKLIPAYHACLFVRGGGAIHFACEDAWKESEKLATQPWVSKPAPVGVTRDHDILARIERLEEGMRIASALPEPPKVGDTVESCAMYLGHEPVWTLATVTAVHDTFFSVAMPTSGPSTRHERNHIIASPSWRWPS